MSPDKIAAVVAEHFPSARLDATERLKGGVSAEVFRLDLSFPDGAGQSLVLRAMGKSGLGSGLEYALLSALHAAGIPTPQPVRFDDSRRHVDAPYVLMAFVDGASDIPDGQAQPRLDLMAAALVAIHRVPTSLLPDLPRRLDPVPELPGFLPKGAEWLALADHCTGMSPLPYEGAPVLLHGDFWPQNLIWRDGRIAAILDWEDAALGDPLSDLACALLELKYLFDDVLVAGFLAAYGRHAPVDRHRLALWQVYVASAAQHYMGDWSLEPSREAHMRQTALRQIRDAAAILGVAAAG